MVYRQLHGATSSRRCCRHPQAQFLQSPPFQAFFLESTVSRQALRTPATDVFVRFACLRRKSSFRAALAAIASSSALGGGGVGDCAQTIRRLSSLSHSLRTSESTAGFTRCARSRLPAHLLCKSFPRGRERGRKWLDVHYHVPQRGRQRQRHPQLPATEWNSAGKMLAARMCAHDLRMLVAPGTQLLAVRHRYSNVAATARWRKSQSQ